MSAFEIPAGARRKPRKDRFGQVVEPGPPLTSKDPVNELQVDCMTCGCAVLVCCYVADVDPHTYRCLDCRPFKKDPRALELAGAVKRAREQATAAARSGDPIPF